ncbi:hypothetical protein [Marinoscillum sp.]|uniref:hypothetical protein n=1 Tax=Marinoscillum sp. TaxID=2024838 RepID=UPI003BA91C09
MFWKKKPKGPTKSYIAYMSKMAKYRVVMAHFAESPGQQLLVYFFDQTRKEIEQMAGVLNIQLKKPGELASTDDLILCSAYDLANHTFAGITKAIAMEVHPFNSINELLEKRFQETSDMQIEFHLGMDEVALASFGMDRIIHVMQQMGMKENEPIEHSMVAKSIERGLQRQEETLKATHQDVRTSQEEWISANKL